MYVHVRVERAHPLPVVAETSCQPHSSCSLDFQCNSNREEKVGPRGVGGLRRLQPQLSHTNSTHYLSPQSSDREEENGVSKAGTASGTSRQTRMVCMPAQWLLADVFRYLDQQVLTWSGACSWALNPLEGLILLVRVGMFINTGTRCVEWWCVEWWCAMS